MTTSQVHHERAVELDMSTEGRNPRTLDLDRRSTLEILEALNDEDQRAPTAVRAVLPQLGELVDAAANAIRQGRRVHYFGAGTSGRLAVLDAAELRPTFALPEGIVIAHHAGGIAALTHAVEDIEDSFDEGVRAAEGVAPDDVVIGIAASGRTPYVGGALTASRQRGAITALMSCSLAPRLAPLADHVLIADTGPEALAGSTRLKAGTAQKLMLNGFSTALMIRLGRTWSNLLVSLVATNDKLRSRTLQILMQATGSSEEDCRVALSSVDGDLRAALVLMLTASTPSSARRAVADSDGDVRLAVAGLAAEVAE